MFLNQLDYDSKNGEGESIELLNLYFYEIIKQEDLTNLEIKKLAKLVSQREYRWITGTNQDFSNEDVIEDRTGYVIISDGTRIDLEPELYNNEREEYNKLQKIKLQNQQTNGKEYLR